MEFIPGNCAQHEKVLIGDADNKHVIEQLSIIVFSFTCVNRTVNFIVRISLYLIRILLCLSVVHASATYSNFRWNCAWNWIEIEKSDFRSFRLIFILIDYTDQIMIGESFFMRGTSCPMRSIRDMKIKEQNVLKLDWNKNCACFSQIRFVRA